MNIYLSLNCWVGTWNGARGASVQSLADFYFYFFRRRLRVLIVVWNVLGKGTIEELRKWIKWHLCRQFFIAIVVSQKLHLLSYAPLLKFLHNPLRGIPRIPSPCNLLQPNNDNEKLTTQLWANQYDHLIIPSSSNLGGGGRSIFPNSAPWPLWPLFLPGIWNPLWLEFGREFSVLVGVSWLSPKRENIRFFFGSNFGSSFSPISSKISSSVSCGRSDWPELRTGVRRGRFMPDSRLCLGVVDPSGRTGDRAEIS